MEKTRILRKAFDDQESQKKVSRTEASQEATESTGSEKLLIRFTSAGLIKAVRFFLVYGYLFRMKTPPISVYLSICLAIFLSVGGCTGAPPSIDAVRSAVLISHDPTTGRVVSFLSVFAQVSDEDGLQDIAEWVLRGPDSQLSWSIPVESLEVRNTSDGRVWFGSPFIAVPVQERPQFGVYELTVRDLAGLDATTRFEVFSLDYTHLLQLAGTLPSDPERVSEAFESDRLVQMNYDEAGVFVSRESVAPGDVATSDGNGSFFLHAYNERSNTWIISGPHRL